MPPSQSSSRTQPAVQRRPRIERACQFCRIAKHRCEPSEYGTNDRPCRRCVLNKLDCTLARAVRSQSPSLGLGVQGPAPIRQPIAPHSTGGATEELTLGSETNVQYPQRSESVQVPMRGWSPLVIHPEEGRGSSTAAILPPGQIPLQTPNFLPASPNMGTYQQSFPNVAQDSNSPESSYYGQDYYGQATPDNAYMSAYDPQSGSDGAPNLGQLYPSSDAGVTSDGQDEIRPSYSGNT